VAHRNGRLVLAEDDYHEAVMRLYEPTPRVRLGQALRGLATSAIDISDGLLGDLGHILRRSGVGARIEVAAVPVSADLAALDLARRREFALAGGDDYELLFTAAPAQRDAVVAAGRAVGAPVARIGRIEAEAGLRLVDADGRPLEHRYTAFDHFAEP
jgi:thiamine-monophosphate kinase